MESRSSTFRRSATSWPRRRRRRRTRRPRRRPRAPLRRPVPLLPPRAPLRRLPPRGPPPPPRPRAPLPPRRTRRRSKTGDNWETPAWEGGGFFVSLDPDRRPHPLPVENRPAQGAAPVKRIDDGYLQRRHLLDERAMGEHRREPEADDGRGRQPVKGRVPDPHRLPVSGFQPESAHQARWGGAGGVARDAQFGHLALRGSNAVAIQKHGRGGGGTT